MAAALVLLQQSKQRRQHLIVRAPMPRVAMMEPAAVEAVVPAGMVKVMGMVMAREMDPDVTAAPRSLYLPNLKVDLPLPGVDDLALLVIGRICAHS